MAVESKRSAAGQADLWSARARDWAELQEQVHMGLYRAVFDRVLQPGTRLFDAGCGSGLAMVEARSRGASVCGLDAAPALVAICRERMPDVDVRIGELEELPHADGSFDTTTGFNSFQYAASPVGALREAKRVTTSGGMVAAAVWGAPEDCEPATYIKALGSVLPPPPPGAPGPFALSAPGALAGLMADAGIEVIEVSDAESPFEYPDEETALRALLSAGPAVRAIRHAGEETVRSAVLDAIRPYRLSAGGYRMECKFRYALGRA